MKFEILCPSLLVAAKVVPNGNLFTPFYIKGVQYLTSLFPRLSGVSSPAPPPIPPNTYKENMPWTPKFNI